MKGLYLVTPDWDDTAALIDATDKALRAGASLVQYRHKSASPELRREQAARLLALCRHHGRPFIVNDFIDLCLELGADGVHVGGTDASVAQARNALGAGRIIGASCYGDRRLAREAAASGASYVAFGGFYPSRVKQYPVTTPPEIVDWARAEIAVPSVVIGGMTPENAAPLVARGADMVAAISSVYGAPAIEGAVRQFARLFSQCDEGRRPAGTAMADPAA
ncbi:thiamine phosphate synthase [Massilia sp. R2A-15]|uniref:thiamine phosphate synthase n=1 Tax=Massilia sp. R2A-15 TaxID=3064278 RepID=UPI0027351E7C|nr:thiamine phosphate synthase [Massilia sp. R2A-15]WLI87803.1 thiamine phosphate synthase [Massilia sp. R2A-15]